MTNLFVSSTSHPTFDDSFDRAGDDEVLCEAGESEVPREGVNDEVPQEGVESDVPHESSVDDAQHFKDLSLIEVAVVSSPKRLFSRLLL